MNSSFYILTKRVELRSSFAILPFRGKNIYYYCTNSPILQGAAAAATAAAAAANPSAQVGDNNIMVSKSTLDNIVGNLWQARQESSGSSQGNQVNKFPIILYPSLGRRRRFDPVAGSPIRRRRKNKNNHNRPFEKIRHRIKIISVVVRWAK